MSKFKKGAKKHKKFNKSGLSNEMIEFISSRPLVIKGKILDPRKNYEDVLKAIEALGNKSEAN